VRLRRLCDSREPAQHSSKFGLVVTRLGMRGHVRWMRLGDSGCPVHHWMSITEDLADYVGVCAGDLWLCTGWRAFSLQLWEERAGLGRKEPVPPGCQQLGVDWEGGALSPALG
jgi:hypothetical protein